MIDVENNSNKELQISKTELDKLQNQLDSMLDQIESDIDRKKQLSKETFKQLKVLVKKITFLKKNMLKNTVKINQSKVTLSKERRE